MRALRTMRSWIRLALALVEALRRAGLLPAHVGIHAGPLIERDGDHFGRTVIVASRITSEAAPARSFAREATASRANAGVRVTEVPAVTLRAANEPMRLFGLTR